VGSHILQAVQVIVQRRVTFGTAALPGKRRRAADRPLKIGVLNDMAGVFADIEARL